MSTAASHRQLHRMTACVSSFVLLAAVKITHCRYTRKCTIALRLYSIAQPMLPLTAPLTDPRYIPKTCLKGIRGMAVGWPTLQISRSSCEAPCELPLKAH
jgi:hypothetical protein